MARSTGYKPLNNGTLVMFKRGSTGRLAIVEGRELDVRRKPGIGRFIYKLRPCTVRDGKPYNWNRAFRLVEKRATDVEVVPVELAARLIESGVVRTWS